MSSCTSVFAYVSLETPFLIPIIFFALICSFGVKHGIEVIGRLGEFFVVIPVILGFIIIPLLIPKMNINNILPILNKGIKPIIEGTFLSVTFPFCYIVGFMMIFSHFKARNSPYKIYTIGLLIGGIIVLATSIVAILAVGELQASILYYPTYVAVSRIKIGYFLQRLEIISAITFMLGIYVEASIFLLVTCRGIAKLFNFLDYRFVVMPVTLLIINLCAIEFSSIMRYFEWSKEIWPYYVFPFEVILPIIIWITAEIKSCI